MFRPMTPARSAQRSSLAVEATRLQLRQVGLLVRGDGTTLGLEPKDALLLAYLALEGPTPRARLAALLWPDADEERARGNLRQRLLRLKRLTGAELIVGNPLAQLAEGLAHDLDDACDVLAGIDPGQGGALADWLQAARDRRRHARAEWLAAALERAQAEGDADAALAHARSLLDLDPLSEHAHRRVMTLHYLRGDAAAALAAYERCRQILKRELNAAPSPETEAMRARLERAAAPAAPTAAGAVPISVLRPPRLVGRDTEWAGLQAAWDGGERAVVLGEAGMGKTRLVTDFARARGRVLIVSARPGDERVVYALIARLLRQLPREALAALGASVRSELARLLPEFGQADPIRSEADRARFYNAVAAALAAQDASLAGLVIDDLHFADAASLELVQYLAADSRLHWLFAARPAEVGAAARALIDAGQGRGRVIELAPLTQEQIEALIASLELSGVDCAAWAPRLLRHTGGNPLFVLETIKAWLAQPGNAQGAASAANLPAAGQVGALIERRMTRLSADAIRLARCAAVAGQDFSAELAAHVLGVRPLDLADAWAELDAAQVFRAGAFAHDLIHEAALASVPAPIARELHREIAEFLASHEGEPVRVARHWLAAGAPAKAVPWLLRAADGAESQGALAEEIELREEAAQIDAEAGNAQREFETRKALVGLYERTTRLEASARNVERLMRMARTPLEQGWALSAKANLTHRRGEIEASVEPARQAFAIALAHDDAELACEAANLLVPGLNFMGRFEEALAAVDAAHAYYQRAGEQWRCQFLSIRANTLNNLQRRHEARSDLAEALALARSQHNVAAQISILANTAISYRSSGLLRESIQAAEQAERVQQQFDANPRTEININLILGLNLRDLGAYDQALERLNRVLGLADAGTPMFRQPALNALALSWLQLGQPARAVPLQREALQYGQVAVWLVARAHLQQGLLLQRLGQPSREWFEAALRIGPRAGRPLAYLHASLALAELEGGDDGYARAMEVDRQARAGEYTGMRIVAQASMARIALAEKSPQRAAAHARDAVALLRQADPDETYRGDVWLAAYRALAAVGDDQAGAILETATAWIRRTAESAVPAECREAFLHRNPSNRELLTLASRTR